MSIPAPLDTFAAILGLVVLAGALFFLARQFHGWLRHDARLLAILAPILEGIVDQAFASIRSSIHSLGTRDQEQAARTLARHAYQSLVPEVLVVRLGKLYIPIRPRDLITEPAFVSLVMDMYYDRQFVIEQIERRLEQAYKDWKGTDLVGTTGTAVFL